MLHACLVSTLVCFVYTLRCFYIFSGTILLTRFHSASCLFSSVFGSRKAENQYSRNWTGQSQCQYFTVGVTKPEVETERCQRATTPPGMGYGGPTPGQGVSPPVASSPIRSPRCRKP